MYANFVAMCMSLPMATQTTALPPALPLTTYPLTGYVPYAALASLNLCQNSPYLAAYPFD